MQDFCVSHVSLRQPDKCTNVVLAQPDYGQSVVADGGFWHDPEVRCSATTPAANGGRADARSIPPDRQRLTHSGLEQLQDAGTTVERPAGGPSSVQRLARNPNCGAFHVYNRVHDKCQDVRGRITAHLRQCSRSCCRSCLPAATPPRRPVRSRPSPRAGRGG